MKARIKLFMPLLCQNAAEWAENNCNTRLTLSFVYVAYMTQNYQNENGLFKEKGLMKEMGRYIWKRQNVLVTNTYESMGNTKDTC